MKLRVLVGACIIASSLSFAGAADPLPTVGQPELVGLSSPRLKRLGDAFKTEVDSNKIAGAVVLIARHGKVAYLEPFGFQDREKQVSMEADAIFRIYSLTKPIVSVAIMMLVEEGKLQLYAPAATYLPEFKDLKVGVEKVNQATGKTELELEPVQRPMTVQDLLRHTSGLTYGGFGNTLVDQAYREAKILAPEQTLSDFINKLATLPLLNQPGAIWNYSVSTDVLGRIVEVLSGKALDEFIAERITKPLGMVDTGFYTKENQADRVAQPQVNAATGSRPPMRDVTKRPQWFSGGGGMISTAADYLRFCQMLLNGGELDGVRLLSPVTVSHMTADHLPPGTTMSANTLNRFSPITPSTVQGQGFGLGFAVRIDAGRHPMPGSVGHYYWVGAGGPVFWVDPKENMIAIMMVQHEGGPALHHYHSFTRNLVYQTIVK